MLFEGFGYKEVDTHLANAIAAISDSNTAEEIRGTWTLKQICRSQGGGGLLGYKIDEGDYRIIRDGDLCIASRHLVIDGHLELEGKIIDIES